MRFLLGLIALFPLLAAADTMYVTDNLRLGLHAAEDTSDRAFRILESGQPMEVLIRGGNYANVRLPDGTEGWVKTAYLVADKPAKLIVTETIEERDALAAELEETRAAFAEPAAAIERLESETTDLTAQLETAQSEIATLQEASESIDTLKARYKGSLPLTWVAGAIAVTLILGFLFGLWYTDYRSRKRHGGIRIY